MASIKKVASHLDGAQSRIEALRQKAVDSDVITVLQDLHAALVELAAIVRTDRV